MTWQGQFQVLLAILAMSTRALAQPPQNPAFGKGVELFQNARYEDALREFDKALQAQPGNAAIENALGLTDTKLKRTEDANRHYENAIRINSKAADPHRNLGVNFLGAGRYESAEEQFRLALTLEPDSPFTHYYLALVFLATNRDRQAAEQAGPARALFSNDPDGEFRMAEACLRTGSMEQGLAFIDTLEKQSALTAAREFELATLLNSKHLYPQVVIRLRRVAEMNPTNWVNRYNLADALLEAGKSAEGLSLLESLSAERPQEAVVLSLLGSAYESAGKPEKALECYRRAVGADPGNHDYYLDYARILADLNGYDESEQFIESSLRQFGNDYALTIRLGALQMMQGKIEEARQTFRKAVNANPELTLGHVAVAQTYLREHRDEEAAAELSSARAKLAPDANVEHYLGLALVRQQRYKDAIAPLQQAAHLNPENSETYYLLGKAEAALDQTAAARDDFERAIHLDPGNASAHYQLSRIYAQMGNAVKAREMAESTKRIIALQREEGLKAQRARLGTLEPIQ